MNRALDIFACVMVACCVFCAVGYSCGACSIGSAVTPPVCPTPVNTVSISNTDCTVLVLELDGGTTTVCLKASDVQSLIEQKKQQIR
jgi:hypothetical protein